MRSSSSSSSSARSCRRKMRQSKCPYRALNTRHMSLLWWRPRCCCCACACSAQSARAGSALTLISSMPSLIGRSASQPRGMEMALMSPGTSASAGLMRMSTPRSPSSRTMDSMGKRVTVGVLNPAPISSTTTFLSDATSSSTHATMRSCCSSYSLCRNQEPPRTFPNVRPPQLGHRGTAPGGSSPLSGSTCGTTSSSMRHDGKTESERQGRMHW
mmetsp:Transcript_9465/g.27851  ORF Transcript_9465/g.27851 Transcript_9465/m.27851 type:complete len:214 (-) Transcript_9465:1646-2287(-)